MPEIALPQRAVLLALAGFLLGLAAWATWEFRPSRQLVRATERLAHAVERRDWARVSAMMAAEYHDSFGFERPTAIDAAHEVFGHFLSIDLHFDVQAVQVSRGRGTVTARVRLGGSGSPVARLVIERCNELRQPAVFSWRSRSWKPWDWELISLDQPEVSGAAL